MIKINKLDKEMISKTIEIFSDGYDVLRVTVEKGFMKIYLESDTDSYVLSEIEQKLSDLFTLYKYENSNLKPNFSNCLVYFNNHLIFG